MSQKGFSLIEVIIFLIMAGILSVIFVSYMGTSLLHSADPVNVVRDEANIGTILEKITSDYVKLENGAGRATAVATVMATDYGSYVTKTYIDHDTFLNAGTVANAGGPGTAEKPNPLLIRVQAAGNSLSAMFTQERASDADPIAYF